MVEDPQIIFTNKDFIIVNKPAGLSVHGGGSIKKEERTLADFLVEKLPELAMVGDEPAIRPGLVHRLDKDTSGVMVVARNKIAFEGLKDLFKQRKVQKTYAALTCGVFRQEHGVVDLPIGRLKTNPTKRGALLNPKTKLRNVRDARTEYSVVRGNDRYTLLDVFPRTGRMHQIRVHLGAIGRPVACDKKYGGKSVCCPPGLGRIFLHARELEFSYPEGKHWRFSAELPDDLAHALSLALSTEE